ncbi:unnamed protein product, partial [Didymodactylos carnosus]
NDLADVEYNLQLMETSERDCIKILQQCLSRKKISETNQKQLMQERTKYLNDKIKSIEDERLNNEQLASKYRTVLYRLYDVKSHAMTYFEHRLDLFNKMKDTRQLIELQGRLHNTMNFYFDKKANLVEKQITYLNASSQNNGLKLGSIQDTIQDAVSQVTSFLTNQVDFNLIHQQAMEKVCKEELVQQQKQQVKV